MLLEHFHLFLEIVLSVYLANSFLIYCLNLIHKQNSFCGTAKLQWEAISLLLSLLFIDWFRRLTAGNSLIFLLRDFVDFAELFLKCNM